MTTKQCRVCGQIKDLDDFPLSKNCKDGHRGLCIECKRAQDRFYSNNVRDKDKQKERTEDWKRRNPDRVREYARQQYNKRKNDDEYRKKVREQSKNRYDKLKTDAEAYTQMLIRKREEAKQRKGN